MHTKIRVHLAGIVRVQDEFTAKLQARVHPVAFRFEMAPHSRDAFFPQYSEITIAAAAAVAVVAVWTRHDFDFMLK